MKQIKLMQGDNILSLKKLPENSIDSIVTDPPYGLSAAKNSGKTSTGGFMGKLWDYDVPSVEFWQEAFRVLKPGGHVLSFGGTRTYHRMVVNMEDAGFEIRDQIMWIYGSGFPKSHNIGLNIDKKSGKTENRGKAFVVAGQSGQRDKDTGGNLVNGGAVSGSYKTDNEWNGWGTALKPANEPICLARKPLSEKTIVDNVIKWGTGGINVDGCRIATDDELGRINKTDTINTNTEMKMGLKAGAINFGTEGRFPANILFDETAAEMLDEQSGVSKSSCKSGVVEGKEANVFNDGDKKATGHKNRVMVGDYSDKGGASRFFYIAKVGKKERNLGLDNFEEVSDNAKGNGLNRICDKCSAPQLKPCDCKDNSWVTPAMKNSHPTLKPINLMTYLCRLITPPGGIILDPFMGSGSTGISACLEGFRFVGMELDEDYFKIAEARVNNFEEYRKLLKK